MTFRSLLCPCHFFFITPNTFSETVTFLFSQHRYCIQDSDNSLPPLTTYKMSLSWEPDLCPTSSSVCLLIYLPSHNWNTFECELNNQTNPFIILWLVEREAVFIAKKKNQNKQYFSFYWSFCIKLYTSTSSSVRLHICAITYMTEILSHVT